MCSHTGTYTERQRETQREFREERKNQTVWCDGLKQRWGRAVSSFYHSIQSLHIPCPNGILVTLSSDTDDVLINSRCWREKSRSPQYPDPGLGPRTPSPWCQIQRWLRIWEVLHYSLGMKGISGFFLHEIRGPGAPNSEKRAGRWEVGEKQQLPWSHSYPKIIDETIETQRRQETFSRSHSL